VAVRAAPRYRVSEGPAARSSRGRPTGGCKA